MRQPQTKTNCSKTNCSMGQLQKRPTAKKNCSMGQLQKRPTAKKNCSMGELRQAERSGRKSRPQEQAGRAGPNRTFTFDALPQLSIRASRLNRLSGITIFLVIVRFILRVSSFAGRHLQARHS